MSKLIQKVKWNLGGSQTEMYMYGEADFEANKAMQEPLEKLYQYENQPDMRDKVREYIGELETEIKRCKSVIENLTYDKVCCRTNRAEINIYESRINTLTEIINDLKGRLEERV